MDNKIEIINNKKLNLHPPVFTCDGHAVGKHLENYDMLKYLNKHQTSVFLGRPGSGKTSLLVSMLTGKGKDRVLYKGYNHIILVMPTSSRASLKVNIFEKHPPEKCFDELDIESISKIYDMVQANAEKKETTMVIYDDCGSSLKDKNIQKILKIMSYNRRHLKLSQYFLLQSYIAIPRDIRKLISNLVVFKPSKVEIENIIKETIDQPKDVALKILNLFEEPHQYIFINVETQKMFRNFDEIIIHED